MKSRGVDSIAEHEAEVLDVASEELERDEVCGTEEGAERVYGRLGEHGCESFEEELGALVDEVLNVLGLERHEQFGEVDAKMLGHLPTAEGREAIALGQAVAPVVVDANVKARDIIRQARVRYETIAEGFDVGCDGC